MELNESFDDLVSLFARTTGEDEMKNMLSDLFTAAEIKDLTLRWKLLNDLYDHKSQRNIAQDLGISLCKITRGSRILKNPDSYLRRQLSLRYDDHLHR